MAAERVVQARQVARTQRHGATTRDAVGRVRETDEPLSLSVLEQLHDRREAAIAGALGELELVDKSGVTPRCRSFRWGFGGHATNLASNV
jgi:hypothetical protein